MRRPSSVVILAIALLAACKGEPTNSTAPHRTGTGGGTGGGTGDTTAAIAWSAMTSPTTDALDAVWGIGTTAFAVGSNGRILRMIDTTWTPMASPTVRTLRGVWGTSATSVFAVGDNGVIVQLADSLADSTTSAWTQATSPTTNTLYAVWAASATDAWAVGAGGTIVHWNGASWSSVTSPTADALRSVWGLGANDVFAVGARGITIHWNGTSWTTVASSPTAQADLVSVRGVGTTLYGARSDGVLQRWTGSAWASIGQTGAALFTGLWVTSANDVQLTTTAAGPWHWNGETLASAAIAPRLPLDAVWGDPATRLIAVGAGGTILRGTRTAP